MVSNSYTHTGLYVSDRGMEQIKNILKLPHSIVRMMGIISKLFFLLYPIMYNLSLYMFNKETSCYEYLSDCRSDCHYSFIRMTIRTQFIFGYLQVLRQ